MSAAHTPGPWLATAASFASNGCKHWINAPSFESGLNNSQPNGQFVAQVGSGLRGSIHAERVEADARLIAAAPELLEALEQCESWIHESAPKYIKDDVLAAIAKAVKP